MLLFSETSKCIFNYMSKKLYVTLVNLHIRICQLSAFFFSASIFLRSFPMQKYMSYLAEHFVTQLPLWLKWQHKCIYDLFPWQIPLFLSEEASKTAQNFEKSLQFLLSYIIQDTGQAAANSSPLRNRNLGGMSMPCNWWSFKSTQLHNFSSFSHFSSCCWPSFQQESP